MRLWLVDHAKVNLLRIAKRLFHFECEPFPSVISNDCFGGEIYRALNLPYNTPFIGLMIMAPCYLRLLKRLEHYVMQDLEFTTVSKYERVNELVRRRGAFPIATLGKDVEIQFLHYKSDAQAKNDWDGRKRRLNLSNVFVKFDYSKDYADEHSLKEFLSLKFDRMLAIGSTQKRRAVLGPRRVDMPEHAEDATEFFRLSLKYIDYGELFRTGNVTRPSPFNGRFLKAFLRNEWAKRA